MASLAVVLRLGVFAVAVAAINAFRHVVNRDVRIRFTVSGNGFTLLNVSVASQALLRFNGLILLIRLTLLNFKLAISERRKPQATESAMIAASRKPIAVPLISDSRIKA